MSKSFWIQVLSAAVIVINSLSGSIIPAEFLALMLAACNLILFLLKDKKLSNLYQDNQILYDVADKTKLDETTYPYQLKTNGKRRVR